MAWGGEGLAEKQQKRAGRHSAGHTGAPNRCSKTEYTRSKPRSPIVPRYPSGYFRGRGVLAFGHPSSKGWHLFAARSSTAVLSARGHFHVLGTRQLYRRDGGSDGGRLLLRQWRHLQRHAEQDCNRCGSSSNHSSTLEYAGRARNASSEAVRKNPTLPVHALLQARSARHGRSTSHSPRRTRWAACRPTTRRSR